MSGTKTTEPAIRVIYRDGKIVVSELRNFASFYTLPLVHRCAEWCVGNREHLLMACYTLSDDCSAVGFFAVQDSNQYNEVFSRSLTRLQMEVEDSEGYANMRLVVMELPKMDEASLREFASNYRIGNAPLKKEDCPTPESVAPFTPDDIADWFLARANSEHRHLKPTKLQKLVYFAYGWYYAYFDKPMFEGEFYAKNQCPAMRGLYKRFESFGGNFIEVDVKPQYMDADTELLLDSVWKAYMPYSDVELNLITQIHPQWRDAFDSYEWDAVISPEAVRDYFKRRLREQLNKPSSRFPVDEK